VVNRSGSGRSKVIGAWAMFAALFAMSAACSGCLWIAIPSLAYEGYKYESGGGHQASQAKQHQNPQPPAANDDVE
jgi:hypothetical protein